MSGIVLQSLLFPSKTFGVFDKSFRVNDQRDTTINLQSESFSFECPNFAQALSSFLPSKLGIGQAIQNNLALNVKQLVGGRGKCLSSSSFTPQSDNALYAGDTVSHSPLIIAREGG